MSNDLKKQSFYDMLGKLKRHLKLDPEQHYIRSAQILTQEFIISAILSIYNGTSFFKMVLSQFKGDSQNCCSQMKMKRLHRKITIYGDLSIESIHFVWIQHCCLTNMVLFWIPAIMIEEVVVYCQFWLLYSWLSLSRPRLSRITAYLEVKIWSLPIHENLTTDGKYCRKEEKLLLRSNFSSFPQYFQYISNFKSPITYQFVKCD